MTDNLYLQSLLAARAMNRIKHWLGFDGAGFWVTVALLTYYVGLPVLFAYLAWSAR